MPERKTTKKYLVWKYTQYIMYCTFIHHTVDLQRNGSVRYGRGEKNGNA
jgi:hypothetical protein